MESRSRERENFFIKGKYLNYIGEKDSTLIRDIDALEITEQKPGLEDIYMYYERKKTGDRTAT